MLRAKYYPRSSFLSSNRLYNCSKLWRNIIQIKPVLYGHMIWKIGKGNEIPLFLQPWFPNWEQFRAGSKQQREATVPVLIDQPTRSWNFETLLCHFGFQTALSIAMSEDLRLGPINMPDTLIFTYAKNGKFTVGKA